MISGTWTGSTAESHASLFSKVRDRHTLPADTHETSKRTLPPDILQRRPGSFEFLTSDNINNGFSKFINVARHLSSLATFASPFWPGWFWVWVCHKHHAITWACFNFLNPIRPIPSHGSIIGPTPISLITSPWNPLVPSSIVSHIIAGCSSLPPTNLLAVYLPISHIKRRNIWTMCGSPCFSWDKHFPKLLPQLLPVASGQGIQLLAKYLEAWSTDWIPSRKLTAYGESTICWCPNRKTHGFSRAILLDGIWWSIGDIFDDWTHSRSSRLQGSWKHNLMVIDGHSRSK